MAAAAWAPPESDFAAPAWAPPESDFAGIDNSQANAANTAMGASADASTRAAAATAMGATPATGPTGLQQLGAAGEAALQAVTGIPAALGGGLSYLATLAASRDAAAAKEVQGAVQNALTYSPRLQTTQNAEQTVGAAASRASTAITNAAAGAAGRIAGPTAENVVQTALPAVAQAAPWLVGAPELTSLGEAGVTGLENAAARDAASMHPPGVPEDVAAPPAAAPVAAPQPASTGAAILETRQPSAAARLAEKAAPPAPAATPAAASPTEAPVASGATPAAAGTLPPPANGITFHAPDTVMLPGERAVPPNSTLLTQGGTAADMTGYTSLTPAPDGSLRITGTYTDPAARGAGLGQQRLAAAAQYAQDKGIPLHSDTTVTAAQVKAYEAARSKGLIDFTPTDQGMYDAALRNKSETAVMKVGKDQPGIQNIVPGPNAPIAPEAAAAPEPPAAAPASNVSEVASSPTTAPAPPAASMFRTPVEMRSGGAAGVGDVSPAEQAERAAAFARIGVEEAHPGAISGDGQTAADALTASKLNSEAGQRFKGVFQNERQSLREAAADAAGGSGGTPGIDPATLYARGNDISTPLDDYRDHITQQTSKAYNEATARVGNTPMQFDGVNGFIADNNAEFLATQDGKQLLKGIQTKIKDLGINSGTANVQSAERLRQFLGRNYSPQTAYLLHGQGGQPGLMDALQGDVEKAVGPQTYEAGRALRRLRETAIDGPEGVSSLLKSRDGIPGNRQTALENVPVQIEKMPQDQFSHLVDVLSDARKAAPDLAVKAERAVNAIRAQFASRVQSIGDSTQGMWNNKGVNTYLRTQEPKMAQVFSPAEMTRFKDINDVGNWAAPDRTYSGAGVQQHNLMQRGVRLVEPTLEAVGAHAFGLPGYITARAVTGLAKKIIPETGKLADAEKVIERPKDYLK